MTATVTCPSWCTRHATLDFDDGGPTHIGAVEHGEFTGRHAVSVERDPGDDHACIYLPEVEWLDAAGARDLAAALVKAAEIVEGETA